MRVLTDVELDVVSGGGWKKKHKNGLDVELEVNVAYNDLNIKKIGKYADVTIVQIAQVAGDDATATVTASS